MAAYDAVYFIQVEIHAKYANALCFKNEFEVSTEPVLDCATLTIKFIVKQNRI